MLSLSSWSIPLRLISATLVFGVPLGSQASQPPAPEVLYIVEPVPRISIRVDTEALDGGNQGLENKLSEVATGVFTDAGFIAAVDEQDPELVIVVDRTGDLEKPTFVVGLSLERAGEIVPNSARQLECSLCTYTDLVDKIAAELPAMVELARTKQAEPAIVDEPDTAPDIVDDGTPDPRKIGPLGYAGIGVAVLGLAGVGAGAGLVAKGIELIPPTFEQQRDFRSPGYAVLGIGGAALIGGIVMIAIDVSKRNQARKSVRVRRGPDESGTTLRLHGLGFAF